jgi:hypothetical protein
VLRLVNQRRRPVRSILATTAMAGAMLAGAPAMAGAASTGDLPPNCHIIEGQTLCAVPELRHDPIDRAIAELAASGLRLGTVHTVLTVNCNELGNVVAQHPSAGVPVARASTVDISITRVPAGASCA